MIRRTAPTNIQSERKFPHWVDIEVPPGGLRARADEIHAWLDENVGASGHGRSWATRWPKGQPPIRLHRQCFADLTKAQAFAAAFGGTLVPP